MKYIYFWINEEKQYKKKIGRVNVQKIKKIMIKAALVSIEQNIIGKVHF